MISIQVPFYRGFPALFFWFNQFVHLLWRKVFVPLKDLPFMVQNYKVLFITLMNQTDSLLFPATQQWLVLLLTSHGIVCGL